MSNLLNQSRVQKVTPTTGQTVTVNDSLGNILLLIQPISGLASLVIALPSTPVEGQLLLIFASQNVTTLSFTGGSMDRVANYINQNQVLTYAWDSVNLVWMLYQDVNSSVKTPLTYDITLTSGSFIKYLTTDGTSTGAPLFTTFKSAFVVTNDDGFNDSAKVVMSNSNKTATITAKRLTFTGVTVVGIAVLGSTSMVAVPNGTVVKLIVIIE